MKKVAIGFRAHSGWTALVAVSLEKGAPAVLIRQRVHLVKTFNYSFRQPYHTAEKMDRQDAGEFIDGVRAESEGLAYAALVAIRDELEKMGYLVDRGALLLSAGRPLPQLDKILQSHALIHTADGELFREALRAASSRCRLRLLCIRERELLEKCAATFSRNPARLLKEVTELGKGIGAPWSQDEKYATLAAWLSLGASRHSQ